MKRIYAIEAWCLDCKRCEVACKAFHSASKDIVKAYKIEGEDTKNRVRVEGDTTMSIAVNCRHCENPRCIMGCISGAMTRHPGTGVVAVDPEKCVGCATCVALCPFGCVRIERRHGKNAAFKCDLCGDILGEAGNPRCVAACPNKALIYIESEETHR